MKKGQFTTWWVIVAVIVVVAAAVLFLIIQTDVFDTFTEFTGCEGLGGSCVKDAESCSAVGGRVVSRSCPKDKPQVCCLK